MITALPAVPLPTPKLSALGRVVYHDSALGRLLTYVCALDCTISEVTAELAALRASKWTAPTFEVVKGQPGKYAKWIETADHLCKHGLNKGCCVTCEELLSTPDYLTAQRPSRFIVIDYSGFSQVRGVTLNPSEPAKALHVPDVEILEGGIKQTFSRCLECREDWTKLSSFEFCGETRERAGDCKKAWLAKSEHAPACILPAPLVRFHHVTPEDVDWAARQSAFPHSEAMPHKAKNFCGGIYVQENWKPRESEPTIDYVTLVADRNKKALQDWANTIAAAKVAKVEDDRRERLLYKECLSLSDEQVEEVRNLPTGKALLYVWSCKRWVMEKSMVASGHPYAPYEARSFNDILSESRTFPH